MAAAIILLFLGTAGASLIDSPTPRPFELSLQRDIATESCTYLSLRTVQPYRDVLTSTLLEIHPPDDAQDHSAERLVIIAADLHTAWARAEQACSIIHSVPASHDLAFPAMQAPLARTLPPPPPMQILPLVVSGNSSNRVDLVFFSDGCNICSSFYE